MPEKQIEISRDGVALGWMTKGEAVELMDVGVLKPEDQFRADARAGWKSLSGLRAPAEPMPYDGSWLREAKRTLSTAGHAVIGTAGDLVGKAKELADTTRAGTGTVAEKLLSGFIPQIRSIVSDLAKTRPFQALRSGVNDEQLMLKVFGAAFDCLPKPVCRFVSEQQFVAFCMKHRAQLLQRDSHEPGKPD